MIGFLLINESFQQYHLYSLSILILKHVFPILNSYEKQHVAYYDLPKENDKIQSGCKFCSKNGKNTAFYIHMFSHLCH